MLHKMVGALNYVEDGLLAYLFVGLGILIVADIPGRKFSITEFYWLEELGRYIMICMTFLGASKAATSSGCASGSDSLPTVSITGLAQASRARICAISSASSSGLREASS